jgi:hypothetical protein
MMRAPKTQCGKLLIRMTQVRSVREKQEIHSSTDDVVTQILGTGGAYGFWHVRLGISLTVGRQVRHA